jgi:hypothetical protein
VSLEHYPKQQIAVVFHEGEKWMAASSPHHAMTTVSFFNSVGLGKFLVPLFIMHLDTMACNMFWTSS